MPRLRDIGREFDVFVRVELENQKQVRVAEDLGVTPTTVHKWLSNVVEALESPSLLRRVLGFVGSIDRASEIMDVPVSAIDGHVSGDMVIVPSKVARLIVEEGLDFEDMCDGTDVNLPDFEDAEPAVEAASTEDLFETLRQALVTVSDTVKLIQDRVFVEDDLLSFLESKRKEVKSKK